MEGKKYKSDLWFFATASFLNDLGHYLFTAIWPIFVTTTIGASVTFLGFVDGFGTALESISQAASGLLSDKFKKRKIFIWLGYLLPSVGSLIYGVSRHPAELFAGKFFDRSGKMRDSPRDAIIADSTEHNKRATAFGILRASDRGGAFIGLAASAMLVSYLSYRQLFLLAAIPGLVGTAIVLIFIRGAKSKDGLAGGVSVSFRNAGRNLKIFTFLSLIFTMGLFSDSFYILAVKNRGFPVAIIPLLYLGYVFFSFVSAVPFGKLADLVGRKLVIGLAYVFLIATNVLFVLAKDIWIFAIAFAIYGLHYGAYKGNIKTFVADLSRRDSRASFLGGFEMLMGLVSLPASLIAGVLWQKVAPEAAFSFAILMSLIALIMIPFVAESKKDVG